MNKKQVRLRRATRARAHIKQLGAVRLSVHRTPQHIYAQLIGRDGKVVTCASSVEGEVRRECRYGGNVQAAGVVGKYIAVRGRERGVERVAFDRSGFKYHGRVKALADAAREHGLSF